MIRGHELAVWLARVHPGLLRAVARQMPQRLGDGEGLIDLDFSDIGASFAPVASVESAINESAWSGFAPTLVDVTSSLPQTFQSAANDTPIFDFSSVLSAGAKVASSPSFLSSIGNFLSSPAGLSTVANTATAYFKSTANQAQAQTANAVLSTQLARAAANQSPAPIGYTRDPYTGAITPVLQTGSGLYPVNNSTLASLVPSSIGRYWPWMVGALVLVLVMKRARGA